MMRHQTLLILSGSLILGVATLISGCDGDKEASQNAADTGAPAAGALQGPIAAPPGATVFIISPENGASSASPVDVEFGVSGIAIAPAGQLTSDSGHHHLLIDTALANPDQPIPADAQHLHYGKGQTEASIELEPGQHTLQLVLGDGSHVPHKPPIVSKVVTITVQ